MKLFEEIGDIYHMISTSQSERVDEAKVIYNNSFDILVSGEKLKFIFDKLTENKEQTSELSIEK